MPGRTYSDWLGRLREAYKPEGPLDHADVALMADAMARGDTNEALRWRCELLTRQRHRREVATADRRAREALAARVRDVANAKGIGFAEALKLVTRSVRGAS